MDESLYTGEPCATFNGLMESPSGLDWNGFVMQGYDTTSPPTPDTFLTAMTTTQLPQPAITEAYYQTPDEPEDDGEILVGMGLYDDKREEDPQLNNYRYTVSSLLGTTFRPQEPRGKGLKLEETWEPPKSDDEEEEEDEDDESED
ncbi:hypothetical protein ESCO_000460 [Escovopsis weberi]|uniref:Uncharacterized protein n=1 Tax=Escovopsis weberi TaxID=150374 RepID=A0A0M8MV70_ESCWE|nr:hypothetical protein ESCO_000460 [Escovopsis weberi]